MSKISSTTYHNKFWLKIGLTALAGLMGQAALAACPAVDSLSDLVRVNQTTDVDGSTIYFCKTLNYAARDPRLEFNVEQEDLVAGGSQAISKNSTSSSKTIQGFPSNLGIDLGSFDLTATNLKPGTLTAAFPKNPAPNSPPHLFNFYTRVIVTGLNPSENVRQKACGNPKSGQYKIIEDYLKNNPSTFQISSGGNPANGSPSRGFLQFPNVKLASSIAPASNLTADLYLYHMNNKAGQFYTRDAPGSRTSYVYCWFGVRAELEIKPKDSSANLQHAGEYILNIDVNTLNK